MASELKTCLWGLGMPASEVLNSVWVSKRTHKMPHNKYEIFSLLKAPVELPIVVLESAMTSTKI